MREPVGNKAQLGDKAEGGPGVQAELWGGNMQLMPCNVALQFPSSHTNMAYLEGDPGKNRSAWAGRWWVCAQEQDFALTAFPEQSPYPFPLTHCSLLFSFAFCLQWETWWPFVARHWFIFSVGVYAFTSSAVSDNLTQFAVTVESNGAMINPQHWTVLHLRQMLIFLR